MVSLSWSFNTLISLPSEVFPIEKTEATSGKSLEMLLKRVSISERRRWLRPSFLVRIFSTKDSVSISDNYFLILKYFLPSVFSLGV